MLATVDDSVREWVWNVGQERPDAEWLCSHYDTWVRNPHYRGLPGRHPEDDSDED
jgi:hypothetical protein